MVRVRISLRLTLSLNSDYTTLLISQLYCNIYTLIASTRLAIVSVSPGHALISRTKTCWSVTEEDTGRLINSTVISRLVIDEATLTRFDSSELHYFQQAVREAATIFPRPLQVDLWTLTLKVVSESRVTWATSVPILVLGLPLCSRLRTDVRVSGQNATNSGICFYFIQMLFQFVVTCTQCSSKLREEKKNRIKYYCKVLFEIQNTNTLFIETRTRVKQLNEFNAVK